jgi:membrane carboxypeptidase/penicillin-binding protein
VHEFAAPSGAVTVQIDADTGELATPNCPDVRDEVFIDGTQGHYPSLSDGSPARV